MRNGEIVAIYDDWVELGFALVDGFGESGRDYYHRISRFNPSYTEAECNSKYDNYIKCTCIVH